MTFGSWGEEAAVGYLRAKGYEIVEKNFRCRIGEIDIIALDGEILVFVEVKTRNSMKYGLPCEAITGTKLQHIKRTIGYYTMIHNIDHLDMRIDVIEILIKNGKPYAHHIENIF